MNEWEQRGFDAGKARQQTHLDQIITDGLAWTEFRRLYPEDWRTLDQDQLDITNKDFVSGFMSAYGM